MRKIDQLIEDQKAHGWNINARRAALKQRQKDNLNAFKEKVKARQDAIKEREAERKEREDKRCQSEVHASFATCSSCKRKFRAAVVHVHEKACKLEAAKREKRRTGKTKT